ALLSFIRFALAAEDAAWTVERDPPLAGGVTAKTHYWRRVQTERETALLYLFRFGSPAPGAVRAEPEKGRGGGSIFALIEDATKGIVVGSLAERASGARYYGRGRSKVIRQEGYERCPAFLDLTSLPPAMSTKKNECPPRPLRGPRPTST